jgi:hypothetical protein
LIAPVLSQWTCVEKERATAKSAKSYHSQVTSTVTHAKARSSSSALERETTACFLDYQAIKEEPRKTQYAERDLKSEG